MTDNQSMNNTYAETFGDTVIYATNLLPRASIMQYHIRININEYAAIPNVKYNNAISTH